MFVVIGVHLWSAPAVSTFQTFLRAAIVIVPPSITSLSLISHFTHLIKSASTYSLCFYVLLLSTSACLSSDLSHSFILYHSLFPTLLCFLSHTICLLYILSLSLSLSLYLSLSLSLSLSLFTYLSRQPISHLYSLHPIKSASTYIL